MLREACLTANELLRHFWAAFPLSSPSRETRVLRLKKALSDQYDRTTAMQVQFIQSCMCEDLVCGLLVQFWIGLRNHDSGPVRYPGCVLLEAPHSAKAKVHVHLSFAR